MESPTWLKWEHLQHVGSFKACGAPNSVTAAVTPGGVAAAGLVAASGGNASSPSRTHPPREGFAGRVRLCCRAAEVRVQRASGFGPKSSRSGPGTRWPTRRPTRTPSQ